MYKHLKHDLKMDHVVAVASVDAVGASRMLVIKVKKTEPAKVWQTLEATAKRFALAKVIIAVDEDVNVRDLDSVNLALCMRTQPHRDFRIVKVPASSNMDFSVTDPAKTSLADETKLEASMVLIDATMKWPFPPLSLPTKEFMDDALRIWQEEGLPRLKLREPW